MNNKKYYYWEGINRRGEKMHGVIDTTNIATVKTELRKQGIISKKIRKKHRIFFTRKVTQVHITFFCRQLATMIKAGIPLIQSLDIAAKSQANLSMKYLIESIKKEVESGLSFSESLHKNPIFFNEIICNLIAVGEKSGKLDLMLNKVASYKENHETIKKKLKKMLTYPLIVLVIASFIMVILLTFVVPEFESLFTNFGADLPVLTRTIINLSTFFKAYWILIFIVISSVGYGFIEVKKRSPWFAQCIDKLLVRLPIFGPIFVKAIIARFSRTLAISFAAGLPLVDALKAAAGVTGNSLCARATDKIRKEVSGGQQMHIAMSNTGLFPSMVIQLITIGEESGALESMLTKVADFYEEDVNTRVDTLGNLLEPIIMTILGLLVGGLIIAMYLPIFKLGSVV